MRPKIRLNPVAELGEREIGSQSLSEWIETTTAGGQLNFHVTGALAKFERSLISERTKAGMIAARKRGAAIGKPPKLSREQIDYARKELAAGRAMIAGLAEQFGKAPLTLNRALRRAETTEQDWDLVEIVEFRG